MRKPFNPPSRPKTDDGPRMNEQITAKEVRLVDHNGEMKGVVPTAEAIRMADQVGLDLVEVSPNAEPPVCKILDHSKYRYELQKKAAEARKKQKVVEVKELKIRPGIEDHDYNVKMKAARRFLEEGNKVKVTMRFRGREMAHQQIGLDLLKRMQAELAGLAKTELSPRFEGRQVIMVLGPEKG